MKLGLARLANWAMKVRSQSIFFHVWVEILVECYIDGHGATTTLTMKDYDR